MTVSASALKIAVTDLSSIVSVFHGITLINKENADVSDKIAAVWQYDSVGNQYLPIDTTLFKTTRFNTATSADFFIVALAGTINIAEVLFTTLINADTAPDAIQVTPGSLSTPGQPNTWSASSGAVDVSINTDQSGAAVFDTVFARTREPVSVYTPGLQGMPAMNYANGSFYNVAKAIFIDGYNSKAVSTITGNTNDETAVISLDSGHGFTVNQTVEIVGLQFTNCAAGSTFRVIESNPTSIKIRVPKRFFMNYTGGASVTVKGASLGWNLEFDYPANYRMVISTSGNDGLPKQYLYIDDKVQTYLNFVYLIGYDMVTAMPATGMPTGTGQTPYDTYAQYSRKNYDRLTQSWHFIGDEHFFYWFNDHISSESTAYKWGRVMFFGHLVADHPELKKHTACIKQNYNTTNNSTGMNATYVEADYFPYSSESTSTYNKFIPIRTIQGAVIEGVKPNLMARHVAGGRPGCAGKMPNYYAQYQPVSGQLMYGDRVDILDQASAQYRGTMPGMKVPLYSFNAADYCGDIVTIDGVRHLKMCSSDATSYNNKMFFFIAIDGEWR